MCQSKKGASLSDTGPKPVGIRTLPLEVQDVLDAAERLHAAIGEYVPVSVLVPEVTQEWKRLGECLAWLQR